MFLSIKLNWIKKIFYQTKFAFYCCSHSSIHKKLQGILLLLETKLERYRKGRRKVIFFFFSIDIILHKEVRSILKLGIIWVNRGIHTIILVQCDISYNMSTFCKYVLAVGGASCVKRQHHRSSSSSRT